MIDAQAHFRWKLLEGSPTRFGIDENEAVWGVLMEEAWLGGGGFTLVALVDGNASLYFSEGPAIIGGITHEPIRLAALALVRTARECVASLKPTTHYPKPWPGRVRFYALTPNGVLTADVEDRELEDDRHPLARLFCASHELIAQFRLRDREEP